MTLDKLNFKKQHAILMNGTMVRATLGGTKSQTRRVVKQLDPREGAVTKDSSDQSMAACWAYGGPVIDCPYGVPGQLLWVRETFFAYGRWETRYSEKKARDEWHFIDMTIECDRAYQYDSDSPDLPLVRGRGGALPGWYRRPAIFMPRAASRIQLTIVSVRVERLNDCSEADAKAEGVLQLDADANPRPETRTKNGWQICPTCGGTGLRSTLGPGGGVNFDVDCTDCDTHLKLYRHLWEAINGEGSWDANPWVWVVEFKRVI